MRMGNDPNQRIKSVCMMSMSIHLVTFNFVVDYIEGDEKVILFLQGVIISYTFKTEIVAVAVGRRRLLYRYSSRDYTESCCGTQKLLIGCSSLLLFFQPRRNVGSQFILD